MKDSRCFRLRIHIVGTSARPRFAACIKASYSKLQFFHVTKDNTLDFKDWRYSWCFRGAGCIFVSRLFSIHLTHSQIQPFKISALRSASWSHFSVLAQRMAMHVNLQLHLGRAAISVNAPVWFFFGSHDGPIRDPHLPGMIPLG